MAVILSPRGNEASNMMKRFVRYEEAAQYFGIDETLIVAYAKAAGAVYQLSKIRLIKIEPLEDYMKHLTKVGRSSKLIQRKFVRVGEGTLIYNIGRNRFIEMARAAGAVYKIGDSKGSKVLIRLDVFDEYMEQFREKPVEMKHPLWKAVYQDVCYPVTKEFREKLYSEIVSQYEKAKEQSENKAKEAAQTQAQQSKDQYMKVDGKELPFR